MKALIILISLVPALEGFSQELLVYTDSVNHFSIGIPKEWQYQISKTSEPGIKLFASRPRENDSEKFSESFNVNIVSFPNSNIESAYSDLKTNISKRKGYEFIREADTLLNNVKYKWHLEKHLNNQSSQPMIALILLGYKEGKGYMVTLASTENSYPKYESLFMRIAATFSVF